MNLKVVNQITELDLYLSTSEIPTKIQALKKIYLISVQSNPLLPPLLTILYTHIDFLTLLALRGELF